jgi:phosphohistidine phosphatase
MARQLWLLRHAEAEPHGTRRDAERRLTERGRQQACAAGVAIERLRADFDGVLFSPRVRARETAELAAENWSDQQRALLTVHPPLSADFDAAQALDALSAVSADGRLLLVGHEPDMSRVVSELTGARADVKKGGLAIVKLDVSPADSAGGELVALLRPRELSLIADPALEVVGAPLGGE